MILLRLPPQIGQHHGEQLRGGQRGQDAGVGAIVGELMGVREGPQGGQRTDIAHPGESEREDFDGVQGGTDEGVEPLLEGRGDQVGMCGNGRAGLGHRVIGVQAGVLVVADGFDDGLPAPRLGPAVAEDGLGGGGQSYHAAATGSLMLTSPPVPSPRMSATHAASEPVPGSCHSACPGSGPLRGSVFRRVRRDSSSGPGGGAGRPRVT